MAFLPTSPVNLPRSTVSVFLYAWFLTCLVFSLSSYSTPCPRTKYYWYLDLFIASRWCNSRVVILALHVSRVRVTTCVTSHCPFILSHLHLYPLENDLATYSQTHARHTTQELSTNSTHALITRTPSSTNNSTSNTSTSTTHASHTNNANYNNHAHYNNNTQGGQNNRFTSST